MSRPTNELSTASVDNRGMDIYLLFFAIALIAFVVKIFEQRQRIALLGSHLQKYQLEKHMQTLTEGYMRALDEPLQERRDQVWQLLGNTESAMSNQLNRFAADIARLEPGGARVSSLPVAIPLADKLFPGKHFDLSATMRIHAQGIAHVANNSEGLSPRDKAFMLSAEMLLLQHTCHWYCRSKAVASARVLARHKTPYSQLVASVSPTTRAAYLKLISG